MVEEQNRPDGESDRRTGPLDLVLDDEVAMVEGERESGRLQKERERERKELFVF